MYRSYSIKKKHEQPNRLKLKKKKKGIFKRGGLSPGLPGAEIWNKISLPCKQGGRILLQYEFLKTKCESIGKHRTVDTKEVL